MVYIHSSVSECKSVNLIRNKKSPNPPKTQSCNGFRSAAIDIAILIAVVCASGFLFYPYVKFLSVWLVGALVTFASIVKEEVAEEPIIYSCITAGVTFSALAMCGVIMCFPGQKCTHPNCRGLRKAAEFDIQLENKESVKNSMKSPISKTTLLFELPKELESELKKIAPPNGRAVVVFKARCGCAVGQMEVPGPRRRRNAK